MSKMTTTDPRRRNKIILLVILFGALIAFPYVVPRPGFWVVSVGIRSLWLGIVAMSLTWLARSSGMLSLGQLAFWGVAGYTAAILSQSYDVSYGVSLPLAIALGTLVGFAVALISVRTQGVYFLMLTLAVSQLFFFLLLQAAGLTRGFQGFGNVRRPEIFGLSLGQRNVLYFVALGLAVGTYYLCRYISRTPFGIALEGIRDSPERMKALGYNIYWYRVAAFTFSAFLASISGVMALFYHGGISPGAVDLLRSVDVLIVSVLGGIASIGGAFVGGTVLTLIANFSQEEWVPLARRTVTGLVFVAVLLFLPGGLVSLKDRFASWFARLTGNRIVLQTATEESEETPQIASGGEERIRTDGQV
jgi:branched-chain amino acid transport system permease protein